mmetsp:Transcript_1569/g.2708  ORF Transcript_1569/g.2708 Transcript_1569/m.2708 type:complete len:283 (+) Transcript_1569:504-1352(+)
MRGRVHVLASHDVPELSVGGQGLLPLAARHKPGHQHGVGLHVRRKGLPRLPEEGESLIPLPRALERLQHCVQRHRVGFHAIGQHLGVHAHHTLQVAALRRIHPCGEQAVISGGVGAGAAQCLELVEHLFRHCPLPRLATSCDQRVVRHRVQSHPRGLRLFERLERSLPLPAFLARRKKSGEGECIRFDPTLPHLLKPFQGALPLARLVQAGDEHSIGVHSWRNVCNLHHIEKLDSILPLVAPREHTDDCSVVICVQFVALHLCPLKDLHRRPHSAFAADPCQ